MLPKDPIILLSYVNTKLRDAYSSLDALCEYENADRTMLVEKLAAVNYEYDANKNQFI